jgi:hypothetical protein
MARTTYIQDPVTHKLVPKDEYYQRQDINAPMVIGDIQPYQSMIDGRMITSRSQHRSHLKQHGMIEIGNETKHLTNKPRQTNDNARKEQIARQVYEKLRY